MENRQKFRYLRARNLSNSDFWTKSEIILFVRLICSVNSRTKWDIRMQVAPYLIVYQLLWNAALTKSWNYIHHSLHKLATSKNLENSKIKSSNQFLPCTINNTAKQKKSTLGPRDQTDHVYQFFWVAESESIGHFTVSGQDF